MLSSLHYIGLEVNKNIQKTSLPLGERSLPGLNVCQNKICLESIKLVHYSYCRKGNERGLIDASKIIIANICSVFFTVLTCCGYLIPFYYHANPVKEYFCYLCLTDWVKNWPRDVTELD